MQPTTIFRCWLKDVAVYSFSGWRCSILAVTNAHTSSFGGDEKFQFRVDFSFFFQVLVKLLLGVQQIPRICLTRYVMILLDVIMRRSKKLVKEFSGGSRERE